MKLKNETNINFVDTATGEIITITTSKEYSTRIKSDQFYMTFVDYIASIFQLKSENTRLDVC